MTWRLRRSQAYAARFYDRQSAFKLGEYIGLAEKVLDQPKNEPCGSDSGQFQYHQSGICIGWVVANVGKIEVSTDQTHSMSLRVRSDLWICGAAQADVADVERVMTAAPHQISS